MDEVLKGNEVEANSIITIKEYQGYCRLSEFVKEYGSAHIENYEDINAEETYLVYSIEGEPLVQIGDEYVLFLSEKLTSEEYSGYYYGAIGTYMGKYKKNDSDLYERYKPVENYYEVSNNKAGNNVSEMPMTLEEMKETIETLEKTY